MEASAEVHFAQKLASNEKKPRDQALKRLKKYLSLKSVRGAGLTDDDLLKIWKGLYYCMWMQDKPLVQEELSKRITGLVTVFPKTADSLRFVKVFFATMAREWHGIDKFRLDKYLMMFRDMLGQTFQLMSSVSWSLDNCQLLSAFIHSAVMNPQDTRIPDGLRLHLADMFMDELGKVNTYKLKMDALLTLTLPFLRFVVLCPKINLVQRVMMGIITEMLEFIQTRKTKKQQELSTKEEDEEEEMEVESSLPAAPGSDKVISAVLTHMFKMSQKPGIKAANRAAVYKLIKLYPEVLATLSADNVETENNDIDNDQITQIFLDDEQETTLAGETQEKRKKKRKRKSNKDISEVEKSVEKSTEDSETVSSAKKAKTSVEKSTKDSENISSAKKTKKSVKKRKT